jgi:hypothetical protein
MSVGRREVDIVSAVEQCETGCRTNVAMNRRRDDGATRLSHINDDGSVAPGPHSPAECRARRGL